MANRLETTRQDHELEPKPVDCIVVLGRGIEQVGRSGWKPTRAIERLTEEGRHPGTREKGLTPDTEGNVVIAGANANVLAAVELFEELAADGHAPDLVIFSAGRPPYLQQDPDTTLSEGKVLNKKFRDRIGEIGEAETIVLDQNKDTKDDIIESLRLARDKNFKEVIFITIALHVDRSTEFLKIAYSEHPELTEVSGRFMASEELLLSRYANTPETLRLFSGGLEKLKESKAWELTESREKRGLEALRSGTYTHVKK